MFDREVYEFIIDIEILYDMVKVGGLIYMYLYNYRYYIVYEFIIEILYDIVKVGVFDIYM